MGIGFCGVLIESHELNRKFCHEPQGNPFVQPHSFPFAVRHNLLSSKESASSSYKAPYPFVLRLEFAAVQIIAVDTERNSGLRKAGYLMKAGYPNQNTVSTGDLNRGRRVKPRLLFGSFCRSKKNVKTSPLQGVSRFCKPQISVPQSQYRTIQIKSLPLRGFPGGKAAFWAFPFGNIFPAFEKAGQNMGRRGAAPYRGGSPQRRFAQSTYRNKKSLFISIAFTGQNS